MNHDLAEGVNPHDKSGHKDNWLHGGVIRHSGGQAGGILHLDPGRTSKIFQFAKLVFAKCSLNATYSQKVTPARNEITYITKFKMSRLSSI